MLKKKHEILKKSYEILKMHITLQSGIYKLVKSK